MGSPVFTIVNKNGLADPPDPAHPPTDLSKTGLGYGTTHSGYATTPVGCRGGSRCVEGCWGFPYLKIKIEIYIYIHIYIYTYIYSFLCSLLVSISLFLLCFMFFFFSSISNSHFSFVLYFVFSEILVVVFSTIYKSLDS